MEMRSKWMSYLLCSVLVHWISNKTFIWSHISVSHIFRPHKINGEFNELGGTISNFHLSSSLQARYSVLPVNKVAENSTVVGFCSNSNQHDNHLQTGNCTEINICPILWITYPADIYSFKVNNENTKAMCEICSRLTNTPEQCQ